MQVILNLARNSIEAIEKNVEVNPKINISTDFTHEQIIVHFWDNGPGIPSIYMDKVLNSYFTTKPHGTGLGLAICRSIIETHGGNLKIQHPNESGAWFIFTLPRTIKKYAG